ncbi:MAG: dephospho-CoA kinase [Planctomycetaceae bacterium]
MSDADRTIPIIGLVGGVGSGKSHLARALEKNHRVALLDADVAGHEALREPAVKEQIRRQFGSEVFDHSGEVDRRKLGAVVFGSSAEQKAARAALEAIVHPRITEKLRNQISATRNDPQWEAIVIDAALLLEAGWHKMCTHLIYIDAEYDQRLARVRQTRGWAAEQLQAREESQFPLDRKRREADDVVDNTQGAERAESQLEAIFNRLVGAART